MAKARALLLSVVLACTSTSTSSPPPEQPLPDATIRIEATSISVGVGYSWGKGTLEYQGKSHPVTMSGLMVVAVGLSAVEATGRVYFMKSLDDFAGNYTAKQGSATPGEGGAGVVMSNQNGVEVRMVAENTGVTLSLGAAGVKLAVEK
jgi:hypothetical protein